MDGSERKWTHYARTLSAKVSIVRIDPVDQMLSGQQSVWNLAFSVSSFILGLRYWFTLKRTHPIIILPATCPSACRLLVDDNVLGWLAQFRSVRTHNLLHND